MLEYCRQNAIALRQQEPLSAHTTFKVGGPAQWFALPDTEEKLCMLLQECRRRGVKTAVIGRGSNLLVSDKGFCGMVISTSALEAVGVTGCTVAAQCGAALSFIAAQAARYGLQGLEFAQGIPGSLGGALVMNAGAYDGEMSMVVRQSRAVSPQGEIITLGAAEHEFGYRTSFFKTHPGYVVLSSELVLEQGIREEIERKMSDFAERRRQKQPLNKPSAGSAYKRPQGHFAGQLIEQCGLKGCQVGGARVSDKHAGFIVNEGGATASDILRLMDHIEKTVKEQTGVTLEREIRLLD